MRDSYDLSAGIFSADDCRRCDNNTPVDFTQVLNFNDFIALYFSADWCGPCHQFTPSLSVFYKNLLPNEPSGLEVVFVSLDRNKAAFDRYAQTMPWLAADYNNATLRDQLQEEIELAGIPTVTIVRTCDWKVVSSNARADVMSFKSKPAELLKKWRAQAEIKGADDDAVAAGDAAGDAIGDAAGNDAVGDAATSSNGAKVV